jgi:two-component system, cell cycle sensor histidine kinase and response regulator CckA
VRTKASVKVDVVGLPLVMGDESRLTQVLMNLLVNAAQAFVTSDPDTNVIEVRGVVLTDGTVRLSVGDNGPGIPADILPRIFDPFFTTKAVGQGTGLGLAVSRGIIAALGGQLTLESQVGNGTVFYIDLASADTLPPVERDTPTIRDVTRGRVLIIDDEPAVLSAMQRVLKRRHDVTTINDSREALQVLQAAHEFDIILCDLMMPYLTGQQLYETLKASGNDAINRFVFVSGGVTTEVVGAFLANIPNDMIEKPFTSAELESVTRRYVLRRELPQ